MSKAGYGTIRELAEWDPFEVVCLYYADKQLDGCTINWDTGEIIPARSA